MILIKTTGNLRSLATKNIPKVFTVFTCTLRYLDDAIKA